MKKNFVLVALLLFSGITFSQTLEKGNLIGLHVSEIVLQPDVSYNQYKEFLLNTLFPKLEEAYKGDVKFYLIEGIKGENKNNYGWIFLFKSAEVRDKWITEEGGIREELQEEFMEVIADVMKEQEKYILNGVESSYTDWVVQ